VEQAFQARIKGHYEDLGCHFAEKLGSVTSAAKAFADSRALTAALQALRHHKSKIFSDIC
jgi:hypothetical protein